MQWGILCRKKGTHPFLPPLAPLPKRGASPFLVHGCPVKICRKFFDSNDSTYKVFSHRRAQRPNLPVSLAPTPDTTQVVSRALILKMVLGKANRKAEDAEVAEPQLKMDEFWVHDPQPKTVEVMSPKTPACPRCHCEERSDVANSSQSDRHAATMRLTLELYRAEMHNSLKTDNNRRPKCRRG